MFCFYVIIQSLQLSTKLSAIYLIVYNVLIFAKPIYEYIKNYYLGKSSMPMLKGVNEDGELIDLHQDYDTYNFCFVEKCRIDSFARLKTKKARRTEFVIH